jgi:tetratricopeptide (TPR) repeat protein
VYADAVGGERGEHIVLAHLAAPTIEQQQRERVLRRTAEENMATTKLARLGWCGGFVERIDVDLRAEDALARLRVLLARPELIRLREIDLRPGWYARDRAIDVATITELVHGKPLRWLGIGTASEALDVAALPPVPGLAVAGTDVDLSQLAVTDLELAYRDALALPRNLERLVIANAPEPAIVAYEQLPLKQLGLVGGDDAFNDAFLEQLAASPLLPRLSSVGFTAHRYDSSNRWLVAHAAAFAHVTFFTAPRWEGGWTHAWHDLAHLYEALDRTADALREFDALVTIEADPTYWADIGMQLARLERRDEALAAHDRALAIDGKCHRAWSGRACLLEDAERFADALVAWDAGQAAGLADVHTWTHRAWTLMRLERNDEALVALDAALAIDPAHGWSQTEKKKLTSLASKARRGLRRLLRRA